MILKIKKKRLQIDKVNKLKKKLNYILIKKNIYKEYYHLFFNFSLSKLM